MIDDLLATHKLLMRAMRDVFIHKKIIKKKIRKDAIQSRQMSAAKTSESKILEVLRNFYVLTPN